MDKILSHFNESDPLIYLAMKNVDFDKWLGDHRQNQGQDYFYSLCRKIIGQQLSGKAATAINQKFINLFPNQQITPQQVLSLDDQVYRDVGLSWGKASYIKKVAQAYLGQTVEFDKLDSLDDELVIHQLTQIKGIGQWTAEMFLMFTLKRPDVFSFGDLGLKRGIEKLYQLEDPTKDQIEKIITPWTPYKTHASITLWHCLE